MKSPGTQLYFQAFFFIVCFTFFINHLSWGQGKGMLELKGIILNNKKKVKGAVIRVYENNLKIDSVVTLSDGRFKIKLPFQKNLNIEIYKYGLIPKKIIFNTQVSKKDENQIWVSDLDLITLEDMPLGLDITKVSKPVIRLKISENGKIQDSDVEYTNDQKLKQNELKLEIEKRKQELFKIQQEIDRLSPEARKTLGIDIKIHEAKLKAIDIIADANEKLQLANRRSKVILNEAKLQADKIYNEKIILPLEDDSTKKVHQKKIYNSNISLDFKVLKIDSVTFFNRNDIKIKSDGINKIAKFGKRSKGDSLNLLENSLYLKQEVLKSARYQLEIDKLNAKSKDDSTRIKQREAILIDREQEIYLTKREIEKAHVQIQLQQLEIQTKTTMFLSTLIGSILLLGLLIYAYISYRNKRKMYDKLQVAYLEIEKLSTIASETDNAVRIIDKEGNYEWINAGYTRLFGFDLNDLRFNHLDNIYSESINNPLTKTTIEDCFKQKIPANFESCKLSKSGKKIWVQTTLTPLLDENNQIKKIIAIDSDISKLKDAEEIIKKQNEKIIASIRYAKKIQEAILPTEQLIHKFLPESFLLYQPRDIVSGDFYWFAQHGSKLFLAVVDCTGHGVPGAFMSMIGNTILNNIVNELKIELPDRILEELDKQIVSALHQESGGFDSQDDGMDITLCVIDKNSKELQVACASHHVVMIINNELTCIEGDIYSIGGYFSNLRDTQYTNHVIKLEKDTSFYLFSDGFSDQIGGIDGKKFLTTNFHKLLKSIQNLSMEEQKNKLSATLKSWIGDGHQLDDILVIGFRVI